MSGCSTGKISAHRPEQDELIITAVQLHIDESIYVSPGSFEETMRNELDAACSGPHRPAMVVFPEYTSAFLAAADYSSVIEESDTFEEALTRIRREDAEIRTLHDFFARGAERTEARLDRIWGRLAREFGVVIAAGTYFRWETGESEKNSLRNTLVLYGPTGRRIYEQDKTYLTDFEKTIIGLSPGREAEAEPVRVDGYDIAFTICRDSFFPSWEDDFAGAEAWISVKANGVSFDQDARINFREALPERIAESEVPYGMTVCLNGRFLDLFWEGESSAFVDAGETVRVLEKSRTPWSGDYISLTLPLGRIP